MTRLTLGALVVLVVGAFVIVPPIPQDPGYHAFADRRPWRPLWKS